MENRDKLELLAKEMMAKETLEGAELDAFFNDLGLTRPDNEVKKTNIPVPVKPVDEGESVTQPKKAKPVPRFVPKENPAPSD